MSAWCLVIGLLVGICHLRLGIVQRFVTRSEPRGPSRPRGSPTARALGPSRPCFPQPAQQDVLPIELLTLVNVLLAFVPSAVIAVMHTTMINASMTAYSTAVGPSSRARKFLTRSMSFRMISLLCPLKKQVRGELG